MIWILLFFIIFSLVKVRIHIPNLDYMSYDSTLQVKGFFIILVCLSHIRGVLPLDSIDPLFNRIIVAIGQLMVTMFFFYSGFGVAESFSSKPHYGDHFFKNRILKTLVHFDIAVIIYIIISLILQKPYPSYVYLTSLFGWDAIGNSNWYIFSILCLYLAALFGYKISGKANNLFILFTFGLTVLYIIVMVLLKKPSFWYNTVLCFPLGMFFSLHRSRIEKFLFRKLHYIIALSLLSVLFLFLFSHQSELSYFFFSCVFCAITIMLTMILNNSNKTLLWLGKYLFEIYILQRIPMNILSHFGMLNPVLFTIITITCTVVLAIGFKKVETSIDRVLFLGKRV